MTYLPGNFGITYPSRKCGLTDTWKEFGKSDLPGKISITSSSGKCVITFKPPDQRRIAGSKYYFEICRKIWIIINKGFESLLRFSGGCVGHHRTSPILRLDGNATTRTVEIATTLQAIKKVQTLEKEQGQTIKQIGAILLDSINLLVPVKKKQDD